MVNKENKRAGTPELDDELAKDVARLYSWANVEDAVYRDFSRQRKLQTEPAVQAGERQETETHAAPDISIENQTKTPEYPTADATSVRAKPPSKPAKAANSSESVSSSGLTSSSPEIEPLYPLIAPKTSDRTAFAEQEPSPVLSEASPALALYSIAGGVGKSTLCANLGRTLCSLGEQILLVDASGRGLLPFYFGASEQRNGLRTFVSPDAKYPPLKVIGTEDVTAAWLEGEVRPAMFAAQRTIFDLGSASDDLLSEILGMCGIVLITLLPDLNSTLTVSRIEASLKTMQSTGTHTPTAFYIFNRFDELNPNHQQAGVLVARQCGDRLLQITIRRSSEVAEALADRMTVPDHAPESEVSRDYLDLALWLRKIAPAKHAVMLSGRWSER